ncbi:hypothetical protein VTI74DRAFT_2872 [Chaetomium olivicolor]
MPLEEYLATPMRAQSQFTPTPLAISTQAAQPTAARTPFSNTGTAKALPALRPVRSLLNETPAPPEHQPALHHSSMMPSNSGVYYAQAASRPYHNGYPIQEPMQPMMSHQPMMNPLQRSLSGPTRQGRPYSVSPPPYHQGLMPPPPHSQPAVPSMNPPPMHLQSAVPPLTPAGPRSRPGSSSAPSSAPVSTAPPVAPPTAASASSKYRKLEPAPTPPHRLSYAGNGQELRTVQFDYREAIKDYTPVEAPPRHGPTQIRGWTHNNIRKTAAASAGTGGRSKSGDANSNTNAGANANSDEHAP